MKKKQRSAIYERKEIFVCLSTGYGKSLCYHALPSLEVLVSCVVLVCALLIALMVEPVQSLRKHL